MGEPFRVEVTLISGVSVKTLQEFNDYRKQMNERILSIGNLGLTFSGLRSIGSAVADAGSEVACGVVDLCCSGYNPKTVAEGWLTILSGLIGVKVELMEQRLPSRSYPRLLEAMDAVIDRLTKTLSVYWNLD